jgi:hypothetical protein
MVRLLGRSRAKGRCEVKPIIDTRVKIIDLKKGMIGGLVATLGSPTRLTVAGHSSPDLQGYRGHYFSLGSQVTFADPIPIMAAHYRFLGAIGRVLKARGTADGLQIEAILYRNAAGITFEKPGRTLPVLLKRGVLFYSAGLADLVCADDGRIISCQLFEASITEHPAKVIEVKP